MTTEIKYEDYVRNIRSNSQTAAVLAARLEKVAPGDLTQEQRKSLRAVVAAALEVQSVQSERDRLGPAKLRPVLGMFVNDWSAIYESLTALSRVSPEISKNGPLAAQVVTSLFPDGVGFVQLPADRAWSEAKRRLDRLTNEDLGEVIAKLIGAHFIDGARRSTAALADAIGTGKDARPIPSSTALAEALLKFGRAVGTYGRLLAASVDEEDEESVARFLDAVAPIDQHRAAAMSRAASGEEEDADPAAPVTPVTPVVTPPAPTPAPSPTPGPTV